MKINLPSSITTRPKLHGWEQDGKFYLSRKPQGTDYPAQAYDTREDAEAEATQRRCAIEWYHG